MVKTIYAPTLPKAAPIQPRYEDPKVVVERLGHYDSGDIANLLEEQGFKGCIAQSDNCPIANYLKARTGLYASACWSVVFFWPNFPNSTNGLHIITPPSVAEFISDFDDGMYPQLTHPRSR